MLWAYFIKQVQQGTGIVLYTLSVIDIKYSTYWFGLKSDLLLMKVRKQIKLGYEATETWTCSDHTNIEE